MCHLIGVSPSCFRQPCPSPQVGFEVVGYRGGSGFIAIGQVCPKGAVAPLPNRYSQGADAFRFAIADLWQVVAGVAAGFGVLWVLDFGDQARGVEVIGIDRIAVDALIKANQDIAMLIG